MRKPMAFIAAVGLILSGCGEEKDSRGLVVLDDMAHTPAHKSQTARTITGAEGPTVHVPTLLAAPAHTVARGERPITLPAEAKEAAGLVNPLLMTEPVLKQGRHVYKAQCAVCHGLDGFSAHAPMAKHLAGVPNLGVLNLSALSDGEVFHVISKGKARMPAMAERMPAAERWAVIHYVRLLARANAAKTERDAFADQVLAIGYSSTAAAGALIEQRDRDAELIHHGDPGAFLPKPPPPQPGWSDLTPSGAPPAKAH